MEERRQHPLMRDREPVAKAGGTTGCVTRGCHHYHVASAVGMRPAGLQEEWKQVYSRCSRSHKELSHVTCILVQPHYAKRSAQAKPLGDAAQEYGGAVGLNESPRTISSRAETCALHRDRLSSLRSDPSYPPDAGDDKPPETSLP